MTRLLLPLSLFSLLVLTVACPETPPAATEGESCAGLSGAYTCTEERSQILECDASNIWRRASGCSQNTTCGLEITPEFGEITCCTGEGDEICFPEGTSTGANDDTTDEEG